MAFVSPTDIQYSLIPETVLGTTPTAGATRYILPVNTGQAPVSFSSADIVSQARRPNGATAGSKRGLITGAGSLDMPLMASPVYNVLFESVLRGKFTSTGTKTLKPALTDTPFSLLSLFSADMLDIANGCYATGFTLNAVAGEGASITFDVSGTANQQLTANNPLANTDLVASADEFNGEAFGSITVGGNTSLNFRELNLQVSQPRNPRAKLGTNVAQGLAVSQQRQVTLTLKAYRESFAVDALLTGQRQAFSFNVGTSGNGYGFFMFGNASIPATSTDNESVFVDITVTGSYDTTALADFYITQLP